MNTDICANSHSLNSIRRNAIATNRSDLCKTLARSELDIQREFFDPANADHLSRYKAFKKTGKWPSPGSFKTEWPYVSAPAAVEAKIINHVLGL